MNGRNCILILVLFLFLSCTNTIKQDQNLLQIGLWYGNLQLTEGKLPFRFTITQNEEKDFQINLLNGLENISITDISLHHDSLFFRFPVFDSEISAFIKHDTLDGNWHNFAKGKDYVIPFSAFYQHDSVNSVITKPVIDITGRWEVDFFNDESDSFKAIGEFEQTGNIVNGTFLTQTGDFRYLSGAISDDKLTLSCFDGAFAFLFKSSVINDSVLTGEFWSGTHYYRKWEAKRNEEFQLENPYELTFLKEGYDELAFSFPDPDSNIISLSDEKFQNKVVLVQILGTWCPNCLDETQFLAGFYERNKEKGLEIIGLSYEKTENFAKAAGNINKLIDHFNVGYDILFAGKAGKDAAERTLPMINHIMSYPTTIFIDRFGKVKKIHTGFSGPATGKHFDDFRTDFTIAVYNLLDQI